MNAYDYAVAKEAKGYSVWSLKPHTGDKRDFLRDFPTKRGALAYIDRMRKGATS